MGTRSDEVCFGQREPERLLDLLSFGIFLLIIGIIFAAVPTLVSDFRSWVEQMATANSLVRPPEGLIFSAVVFFGILGLSDFFKAVIRLWVGGRKRRALANAFSGIALTVLAYLIYLYGSHVIRWQLVFALEAVSIGLLIVLYSTLRHAFADWQSTG